jgi:hypothetical protein
MILNKKNKFTLFLVLLISLSSYNLFSQFITPEEVVVEKKKTPKSEEIIEDKKIKKGVLPVYIAYNIKVDKVPYMDNSVKITWNTNPHYDAEFIIGRSNQVIDSKDRALTAKSITVIQSRGKGSYIDSGLKSGNYYYAILSKDKIAIRDIELYRNVNYNSFPVVIKNENRNDFSLDNKVNGIKTIVKKSRGVLITWKMLLSPDIKYNIYRSRNIIDTKEKVKLAFKVTTVKHISSYIDPVRNDSEGYFYAITVTDKSNKEYFEFESNENYTEKSTGSIKTGSFIFNNFTSKLINNIDVKLEWDISNKKDLSRIMTYELYRSDRIINDPENLRLAKFIDSVKYNANSYLDKNPGPGTHYYAVLAKFENGMGDVSLSRDKNFTSRPILIKDNYRIVSINAKRQNRKIKITWKFKGKSGNKSFRIFRSRKIIKQVAELNRKDIIDDVDITEGKFTDKKPDQANLYYGLIPDDVDIDIDSDYKLYPGISILKDPVKSGGSYSGLDKLLKDTYFLGKYNVALKELRKFIKNSENEQERSKANLFIARIYIDKKYYRKALDYLLKKKVIKYFPEEYKFWKEYVLIRLYK